MQIFITQLNIHMSLKQSTAGNFLSNATSIYDQLMNVAHGLLNIPSTLNNILNSKPSLASLANASSGSLNAAVSNIVNSILQKEIAFKGNLLAQSIRQQYQNSANILNQFNQLFKITSNLANKAQDTISYNKSLENSAYSASSLTSCILSSADNIQKQTKTTNKLSEFSNKLTNAVSGKSGIINNYVQNILNSLNTAKTQLNLQNFL